MPDTSSLPALHAVDTGTPETPGAAVSLPLSKTSNSHIAIPINHIGPIAIMC